LHSCLYLCNCVHGNWCHGFGDPVFHFPGNGTLQITSQKRHIASGLVIPGGMRTKYIAPLLW
jgi:hypothetical protein